MLLNANPLSLSLSQIRCHFNKFFSSTFFFYFIPNSISSTRQKSKSIIMASGSSGRPNSAPKPYDFASDDILCSYNDFNNNNNQDSSISHSDPTNGTNKEFHKSRMARMFSTNSYSQPDDYPTQDVISIVESTMKKYTDNLMRFLEGISSRLSQLELYCYNLDKSIGEMRSDLARDHGEEDTKLRSLEKELQEVHRSVQILRDKQELAETQKELAKIQLTQKESSTLSQSQHSEERAATPSADSKNTNHNTPEAHDQQLALALPHQIAPQPSPPTRPVEQPQSVPPPSQSLPQNMTQPQQYCLPPTQVPQQQAYTYPQYQQWPPQPSSMQPPQSSSMQPPQTSLMQPPQPSMQPPQPPPMQPPQLPHMHPSMQPHQLPNMPAPPMQPQVRPPSTSAYSPYPPSQPTNPSNEPPMSYGYGGPPPQNIKNSFGAPSGDGYNAAPTHHTPSSGNSYVMYENEGGRSHHPTQQPQFQQGGYPPQPNSSPSMMARNQSQIQPQYVPNNPYNDLIEKLVNMGFRGEHVGSVIQRLEESGQTVDFNAVLDRLNAHSSGGSQRGWSG